MTRSEAGGFRHPAQPWFAEMASNVVTQSAFNVIRVLMEQPQLFVSD
jgi:hypothetical protein